MHRILKGLGLGLAAFATLALGATAYLFIASQRVMARTYDVPVSSFDAPSDSASVRRGKRLATIYGCNNCHGPTMQGTVLYDEPGIARISAPNLTSVVKEYTDGELERVIRHGVKRDGRTTWIMPSPMFNYLTDDDLGAIIAYVRSVPEARGGVGRETTIKTLGRIGIVTGQFRPHAADIDQQARPVAPDTSDPLSHGRYLVMTACTECHGVNLRGTDIVKAPNLLVSAAYSDEAFAKLMRTGVGLTDRDLGLMREVGQVRFSQFTDTEVRAIRTYLAEFVRQGGERLP
jgi:mono/diheme cytochrome c family protein